MTRKTWTADIEFEETEDATDARITIHMDGAECVGRGSARRNPRDPSVPLIGEELAAARAFADLSHKLVDESAQILELHLGRHVELTN
jgi:Domain of unknown function (DUF1876)